MKVRCKNCQLEPVCEKAVHYARGKRRECVKFIPAKREPNKIPIRKWLNPEAVKAYKKEQERRRLEEEQAKLLLQPKEIVPHTVEAKVKVSLWERVKRFIFFWRR
ncbi:MAG: hypothetical protein WC208_13995 [Gallionella sp.]|jgi:hypothetical protein